MNRKGLTLIELMVYIVLSMMLTTLLCLLGLSVYRTAQQRAQANDDVLMLSIALHRIARDLKQGFAIKEASKHRCIVTVNKKDLGWVYKKGKLMRYTGHYNMLTQKWSHVGSSQLATSVDDIKFTYDWHDTLLKGISCQLSKSHITLKLYTGLL